MEANERISQLLMYLNINAKVLSEKLGYDRPQLIYDIIKGKTKGISSDLCVKITSAYPDIDKLWLLTGEGTMLKNSVASEPVQPASVEEEGEETIETKVLAEIAELRKIIAIQAQKNKELTDRLLVIIEKLSLKQHH